MYEYFSNTLVPKDVRGKKLTVKLRSDPGEVSSLSERASMSGCRGCMVAAVYLDKWRGAVRFIL